MIFDSNPILNEMLSTIKYSTKLIASKNLCDAVSKFNEVSFDVGEVTLEFIYHGRFSTTTYRDELAVVSIYTLKAGYNEPIFFHSNGHISLEDAMNFICHKYYDMTQFRMTREYWYLQSDIGFQVFCRSLKSYWYYASNVKYDKYGRLLKTLYSHPDFALFDENDDGVRFRDIGLWENNEYSIDIVQGKREYYAN